MKRGRNGLILLGGMALATLAGSAIAKGGEEVTVEERAILTPAASQTIPNRKPQNDLAAMELLATFEGDPTESTATMLLIATCKNLGSQRYQPGLRRLHFQRKQGNRWITVQGKNVPLLSPGQTFSLRILVPVNDPNSYRVVITPGQTVDENPGNDRFLLTHLPVVLPR